MSVTIHVLGLTEGETFALGRALDLGTHALLFSDGPDELAAGTPDGFARYLGAHSGGLSRVIAWLRALPPSAGFTLRGTHGVLFVSQSALEAMGSGASDQVAGCLTQGETPGLFTHAEMQARLTPTAEVAREQFAALQDDAALDSAVDSFLRGLKARLRGHSC